MRVVVYTKAGCPRCDEVCSSLTAVAEARGITVEAQDITFDKTLWGRYRYAVPVVVVDGIERLRCPFESAALQALLEQLARSDDGG